MKKLFVFFSMMMVAGIMAVNLTSCGEDEPDPLPTPTVQILVDVDEADGYTVNITVQATDAATFAWDYGDGNTSAVSGNHTHTYEASDSYTISVTVDNGEGLTANASKTVTIVASIEEMIAGTDDNGKTWVLTQADGAGKMGVGHVENEIALIPGMDVIPANILVAFGMDSEYPDEFTFYKDGKFTVDTENGRGMASAVYGGVQMALGATDVYMSPDLNQLPLSIVSMASVNDGTWAISYDQFKIMAQNEVDIDAGDQVFEEKTFSFTEGDTRFKLDLSTGGYIGFFDMSYPAAVMEALGMPAQAVDNSFYIVKSVTPDEINVAIASCGLGDLLIYPTYMLHLTFIPK